MQRYSFPVPLLQYAHVSLPTPTKQPQTTNLTLKPSPPNHFDLGNCLDVPNIFFLSATVTSSFETRKVW
eukprot:m.148631 g.148631  ORF g.148631 m.148631 type:complete len:69 (-) comp30610_c0_seq1:2747-2953(-)